LGFVPPSEQPFSANSKKGFYGAANNKITHDNAVSDAGTQMGGTTRYDRIEKLLSGMIESGKKISIDDYRKM
jgi:hypothetical protein